MQSDEATVVFPKHGSSYDVQDGPDVDQLLLALKSPEATVTFTFVGEAGNALVTNDIEVRVNSATPLGDARDVFAVGGSVVTTDGTDERFTVQHYDTTTRRGTQAGIFL